MNASDGNHQGQVDNNAHGQGDDRDDGEDAEKRSRKYMYALSSLEASSRARGPHPSVLARQSSGPPTLQRLCVTAVCHGLLCQRRLDRILKEGSRERWSDYFACLTPSLSEQIYRRFRRHRWFMEAVRLINVVI